MAFVGSIVNAALIALGSIVGIFFRKGIPERFKNIIFTATGTAVFFIGITGVCAASLTAAKDGVLSSSYILELVIYLVIGGVIGEFIGIDAAFNKAGDLIRKKFSKADAKTDPGAGFATATILFCSGAMAIIGAIENGITGNPQMLVTKGVIDGITSVIFATVYGIGVLFSGFSVLIYQGSIALLATVLKPYLLPEVVTQMSLIGSGILTLLAFSLWEIKGFKVANLIPGAFLPFIVSLIKQLF